MVYEFLENTSCHMLKFIFLWTYQHLSLYFIVSTSLIELCLGNAVLIPYNCLHENYRNYHRLMINWLTVIFFIGRIVYFLYVPQSIQKQMKPPFSTVQRLQHKNNSHSTL